MSPEPKERGRWYNGGDRPIWRGCLGTPAAGLSRLETHGQNTRTYHDQKARLVVFDAGIPCQKPSTRPPRPKRDSPGTPAEQDKPVADPAALRQPDARRADLATATVPDAAAVPGVNPDTGLDGAEVEARRKTVGFNEVAVTRRHPLRKFLGKFWGISAWMLELIMVLSIVLGKYSDLVVVGALLIVNAVLSFLQEQRAEGVVETLRQHLQVSARVLRAAAWQVVPARELVPGDILRLRSGDIIPADVKLLSGAMSVDQSALTGESKDAERAPKDVLPSGAIARREGTGVVMLTGARTLFGRTTELVQEARPKLHIEAVVASVMRWLFVIVGALLAVVVVGIVA